MNWLLPPDMSPLEITLGYEQVAIEVTASIAQHEPDPYLAQVYRFGLLEDFDHLYRYSALYERTEGKDPNNIFNPIRTFFPADPPPRNIALLRTTCAIITSARPRRPSR